MNVKSYVSTNSLNMNSIDPKMPIPTSTNQIHDYAPKPNDEIESVNLDVGVAAKTGFDLAMGLLNIIPATKAVIVGKIRAGAWDVIENIGDGFLNLGSVIVEKEAICSSKLNGDIGENTYDIGMNIRDWLREDISIKYVDELEKEFFENSTYGSNINNSSVIKYDSGIAEVTEAVSKFFSEAVAAVGITFATGGIGATSITIAGSAGFMERYGSQGENYYQKSFDLTGSEEAGMVFSGITGALDWIFKQKAGSNVVNFVNQSSMVGVSRNIADAAQVLHDRRRKRGMAVYLYSMAHAALGPQSLLDISNGVMSDISNSLINNRNINYTEVGINAMWNGTKNALFGTFGTYSGSLRTASFESIDSKLISLISIGGATVDATDDATPDIFSPYKIIMALKSRLVSEKK